jgi:AmmeMemoRadiSam system protein A
MLTEQQKKELLKLSRDTIAFYLESKKIVEKKITDPDLCKVMGVFVTLRKCNQLRGCIGNIVGTKPLYLGVIDMSVASATQDPRFMPVTKDDLADIDIEISVLSPLKKITNPDEIIIGVHGVLVKNDYAGGVYLPQVATETGWSKEEFMNSLCGHKAGMESDAWKTGACEIHVFTAEVFSEH